ncbi:uncharacterized protein BDR25DRAFT_206230, partial [Lindgomyces ingoldianus]
MSGLSTTPSAATPSSPAVPPTSADVASRTSTTAGSSTNRAPSTSPARPDSRNLDSARKVVRNVSPGLLARMKFLNQSQESNRQVSSQIGRIPESQIRVLDEFHKEKGINIERRGTAWGRSGSQVGTPLIPQLTGESVPALALAMDQSPPPGFESDRSSFVSTSDRVLPSDSEAGDTLGEDTQKYRLPDITKTKSLSQTIAETES